MSAPSETTTDNNTTTKSSEGTYTIKGSVKYLDGKPVRGIKIQVMDSDQEAFQDYNDDVIAIVPINDSDGTFEVVFDPKAFKDGWLEGHPDVYLMVRNALDGQVIHRSDIRKGIEQNSPDLIFDITINSIEEYNSDDQNNNNNTPYDPFQGNNERVIAAFTRLGDVVELVPGDIHRNFALLVSSINGWTSYTQEGMWRKIEYDGPQIPRYPWRERHSHKLSWE